MGLIFQKPSTRTRVSFEVGVAQLGGHGLYLAAGDLQLGRGETIKDTAKVLERYLDAIMIRTFDQEDVEQLAEYADIPVINGLTDYSHPCQALADLMTIRERLGRLSGVRLAYLGDGNNVCVSLMLGAARFGMRFTAATPPATSRTRTPSPPPGGPRCRWAAPSSSSATHRTLPGAPTSSTPTSGRAWARRRRPNGVERTWPTIASTTSSSHLPHPRRSSSCLRPLRRGDHRRGALRAAVSGLGPAENRLHAQKALLALIVP